MLYLVKVGALKENIFYELLTHAVSSERTLNEVERAFEKRYEGLAVKVEEVESFSEPISHSEKSYLENIWVSYTEEERKLYDDWKAKYIQGEAVKNELERLIRERYRSLNYTAINTRKDIILETSVDEGTLIKYLPLNGRPFCKRWEKVGEGTMI
jgi:hypothetical protein